MQAKAKTAPTNDKFPHAATFLGFTRYTFVFVGAANHDWLFSNPPEADYNRND